MFAFMELPRVGVSRCLLGDEVRYDGTHRRDAALIDALSRHVEWVSVSPEVEIGMGTPREPIELARADGVPSAGAHVRLLGVNSAEDWTDRMQAWARERLRSLVALGLSGYVCKARSPSCGTRDVPVRRGSVRAACNAGCRPCRRSTSNQAGPRIPSGRNRATPVSHCGAT